MSKRFLSLYLILAFLTVFAWGPHDVYAATTPSILDTPNVTVSSCTAGAFSGTYTVPAGGSNKVAWVQIETNGAVSAASLNGTAASNIVQITNTGTRATFMEYINFLNPSTGTLSITTGGFCSFIVYTTQDTFQGAADVTAWHSQAAASFTTDATTTTTITGGDLLVSYVTASGATSFTHGTSQTELAKDTATPPVAGPTSASSKAAASTPGSETMTENWVTNSADDIFMIAVKPVPAAVSVTKKRVVIWW